MKVWHAPPIGTRWEERFVSNTCILPGNGSLYASWSGGIGLAKHPYQTWGCPMGPDAANAISQPIALGNNTVYVPEGDATVACSERFMNSPTGVMPLAEYQKAGNDRSTRVVEGLPTPEEVELWATRLLTATNVGRLKTTDDSDLQFSRPIQVTSGCFSPAKTPGGPPRSSCSSDAIYSLDRMGGDILAGPNGSIVRSRNGGQDWKPLREGSTSHALTGHAFFWTPQPG
eukprot:SAG22_NODE_6904_length_797_cov_0.730659_1_plen_228_part_01